jgi:hypothetical protein
LITSSSSSSWRPNLRKDGAAQVQPNIEGGFKTSKKKKDNSTDSKGKVGTNTSRNHDIKYFLIFYHVAQCEILTNKEDSEKEEMPSLKDASDECIEYSVKGKTLVVKQTLNMHVKVGGLKVQRENIFHMRCHVYI